MRKRIIASVEQGAAPLAQVWLNLEDLAEVEVTSEDAAHPVESALLPGRSSGWLASKSGKQTIRLIFPRPQSLRRIWLNFSNTLTERTQEYTLRWSADCGKSFREIVRQQWNFSPLGATSETEEHHVDLPGVTVLELTIVPDIRGGDACASLAQLRLA
jgi:hypothetical protein